MPDFPEPAAAAPATVPRASSRMCNQKGGVGKTTTTINLGAALAEFGRRVLLVDFDPQGALSVGLGVRRQRARRHHLQPARRSAARRPTTSCQTTATHDLDVIPANIDLSAAEVQLVSEVAREQILARVLRPVMDDYDVILIDCQPSLGLLTVNALTAAHGVIIPLECEFFAMRGVALLVETIDKITDRLNPRLRGRRHPRDDVRLAHPAQPGGRAQRRRATSATRCSTRSSAARSSSPTPRSPPSRSPPTRPRTAPPRRTGSWPES